MNDVCGIPFLQQKVWTCDAYTLHTGAVFLFQSSCGLDNTEDCLRFTSTLTKSPAFVMPALAPSLVSVTGAFSYVPVLFVYGHPHDNKRSLKAKVTSKWPWKQTPGRRLSRPWASLKCLSFGSALYIQITNRLHYANHKKEEERDLSLNPLLAHIRSSSWGVRRDNFFDRSCKTLYLTHSSTNPWQRLEGTTWGLCLYSLKS